jgi:UDP-N-acetylglucosamine/UDP-N-acetylgalactosamine diphosphorylase
LCALYFQSLDLSRIDRIIRRSLGSKGEKSGQIFIAPIYNAMSRAPLDGVLSYVVLFIYTGIPVPAGEPVPESSVSKVDDRSPEDKERWWKKGLKAISEGKLAIVLLAGGQVI